MKNLSISIIIICLSFCFQLAAQDSSAVTLSGYAEIYYSFDFDNPVTHEKPFFLYNHKRHNEVNVNLAYAKASYNTKRVRSNLALMIGTYPIYNLAAEPELFRFVFEANIGVKLSSKHNLWIDAGIIPSHIGFESAVAADCWTPSRSIVAENSPYYETGVKLTSTNRRENFFVSVLVLNGWQRIQRPESINKPSFGLQFNYKPNDHLTVNYSNFLGTDQPDTVKALRTYHNVYAIYQLNENWGLTTGFDLGIEKIQNGEDGIWYAPVLILRRRINNSSFLAFRGEYFNDSKQVLIPTGTVDGFQTFGLSLNYDYSISNKATARIEGKGYFANNEIFNKNKSANNYSLLLTMSLKL